jgi:hypothetical protein
MPWQITTHAVGEEDGTTYPSGEEEVGPITRPGEEEEHQTAGDGTDPIPASTAATGEEAGQEPKTALVGEQGGAYDAAANVANPFGAY